MRPAGVEPTIWAGERPQTYALDRAAIGTGNLHIRYYNLILNLVNVPAVCPGFS